MLLLFLAAAASAQPTARPLPPPASSMPTIDPGNSSAKCPPISRYEAAKRGGKLKRSLLDELPMADMYKAVYRRVGECVSPVILKYGLGK